MLERVSHAASAAADAVKHAADVVTHSAAYEAVQHAAHNVVEGAKHALSSQAEQPAAAAEPAPAPEPEPAKNDEAQVNQTGTDGFDEAEAVTKPNTEEGQPGEHPKPDIHL